VEEFLRGEVADLQATRERGEEVWPIIDYADIAAATVSVEALAQLKRRGCAVVRGHFDRDQAEQWDRDIVEYVDSNHFFDKYSGPADDFFGDLEASKPEVYPVYWSSAQMEARQHPRMATVQAFLNAQWVSESGGRRWFDPNQDTLYPDRIRRRPPSADSGGLGAHLDAGTLDLWMTEGYQQTFRHVLDGDFAAYDPWDASFRTEAKQTDAVSAIPSVEPGDSVWWHCDMIHSVAPVKKQQGWGNVMYIPAAAWCSKNEDYSRLVREAFLSGRSPFDFPEEDYEVSWPNRFSPEQLNDIGRRGLGL